MGEILLAARAVMAIAGFVLLAIGAWVVRNRNAPALQPFVVLVTVVGTLAVADGLAAGNLTTLALVWGVAFVAIPCAFTWFVVEYYGLPHLASVGRKAVFLAPAVVGALGGAALTVSAAGAGSMAGSGPTAAPLPQPLGFAGLAEQVGLYYAGGVMLAGVALLARTVTTYEYLDKRLGIALSFVAVWPWFGYFITPTIASHVALETIVGLTASGYVLSAISVGFAVTRGGLFAAAPAAGTLGPETVLADLDDAVIVVDRTERVVNVNDAAIETFGLDRAAVTGATLTDCVGANLETLRAAETIEVTVPDGTRQFAATVSPVRDRRDRQPGFAIVISDVTRERLRSQRLAVLNRALRHNLRNQMNSIIGQAEVIADGDHDHTDSAETILTSADDLMSLSDRAREVERIMSVTPEIDGGVSVAALAKTVVKPYRQADPDAAISVDIDDELTVAVDRRILAIVLDNLVENAVRHNDAPTTVVTVSARVAADGATTRLSVADNGPGLPEQERAPIENGAESPLDHGSGLGLWAVKWGVVRLGGELEFADNNPDGTVVTMRLPRVTASKRVSEPPAVAD